MYREAIRDLEPAVRSDEFNAELRLLYGTSLRHIRRYDDSLYNLSIAIKLDPLNWAAEDEQLKVYMDRYAEMPTNSDRISASKTATQLMSMRGAETDQPALEEAKQQAEEIIARFQDPVGLWRNEQQEIEIVHAPDGKFRVKEHLAGERCAQTCFSFTFEKMTPQTFEGSGLNTDTICVFDFSYDLTFSDAATHLSLIGKHVRYRGPDPVFGSPDLNAIRARSKMCAAMVRDGLFSTNKEMAFERIR
jgi:tetratricopeptide (TPR) repeat protein